MAPHRIRRRAELEAKVAFSALSGAKTLSDLPSEYGIYQIQITCWKQELIARTPDRQTLHRSPLDGQSVAWPIIY